MIGHCEYNSDDSGDHDEDHHMTITTAPRSHVFSHFASDAITAKLRSFSWRAVRIIDHEL